MLKGDHSYQRRQEKILPSNGPSSGQRGKASSRFKKWLREKYSKVHGFFSSETPFYIRHFFGLLVGLGLLGGFLALSVPQWKSWDKIPLIGSLGSLLGSFIPPSDKDKYPEGKVIADLRLHILYITGGVIAILTLLQTNWKNYNDKIKNAHDIDIDMKKMEIEETLRWKDTSEDWRRKFSDFKENIKILDKDDINTYIDFANTWITKTPEKYKGDAVYESQRIIDALCSTLKEQGNNSTENIVHTLQKISSFYNSNSGKDTPWKEITYDFSDLWIGKPLHGLNLHNVIFSEARFAPGTGFTSCNFSGNCSFWGARSAGRFHIKSSNIAGKTSFIDFHAEGEFIFSAINMLEVDLLEFMSARFFDNASFNNMEFPEGDSIGLNHAFPRTYFSNRHDYNFTSNSVKTKLALRNLKGKEVEIPAESLLFDPNTYEFEFQNLEVTADHYVI